MNDADRSAEPRGPHATRSTEDVACELSGAVLEVRRGHHAPLNPATSNGGTRIDSVGVVHELTNAVNAHCDVCFVDRVLCKSEDIPLPTITLRKMQWIPVGNVLALVDAVANSRLRRTRFSGGCCSVKSMIVVESKGYLQHVLIQKE